MQEEIDDLKAEVQDLKASLEVINLKN